MTDMNDMNDKLIAPEQNLEPVPVETLYPTRDETKMDQQNIEYPKPAYQEVNVNTNVQVDPLKKESNSCTNNFWRSTVKYANATNAHAANAIPTNDVVPNGSKSKTSSPINPTNNTSSTANNTTANSTTTSSTTTNCNPK